MKRLTTLLDQQLPDARRQTDYYPLVGDMVIKR